MSDWEIDEQMNRLHVGPNGIPCPSQESRTLRKAEDIEACLQTVMASQCTLIERYKELAGKIDALGRMIRELKPQQKLELSQPDDNWKQFAHELNNRAIKALDKLGISSMAEIAKKSHFHDICAIRNCGGTTLWAIYDFLTFHGFPPEWHPKYW